MRSTLCLILLAVGCKSKQPASEANTKPAAPVETAIPIIKCSKAVPDAIKAKYFPDGKLTGGDDPVDSLDGKITSCDYRDDKRMTEIEIRCGQTFTNLDSYLASIESQVAVKYQRIDGVGRGAYAKTDPLKPEFAVVHPTLPCLVDVEVRADDPAGAFDPKPVALAVEAALAP